MASIEYLMIEVDDMSAADGFFDIAFGMGSLLRMRPTDAPTNGFRGFTLSLVVPRPADVDLIMKNAINTGATTLKPASKSLWGYGGVVRAKDGTIGTVASSSKKSTEPATGEIDDFVLQIGVSDVRASKQFYSDHGFDVGQSYGGRYVELDTGPIKLALYKRRSLAKTAGVSADGTGSHRLVVFGDTGPFTDPDGFVWEST